MTTLQQQIDELRRQSGEKLDKDIALLTMKHEISEALGLHSDNWSAGYMHAYRADCYIRYTVPDLPSAIELAEKLDPVPAARQKGTFLTFCAMERVPENTGDTIEAICPYIYTLGFNDKTVQCWVRADNFSDTVKPYLIRVDIHVENDPDTRVNFRRATHSRTQGYTPARTEVINNSGYFPQVARYAGTEDHPGKVVLWSY